MGGSRVAHRRRSVFVLLALGVVAVGAAPRAIAQSSTTVGVVGPGQTAFTFVGRIEQNGTLADDFGYLTSIDGLDETLLFTGTDPLARSEATARFTYFASATLQTRSVNGNLFITSGTAKTTLYFDEAGGASFDDPVSFKNGRVVVATYESHWQDIVNVQAPNQGIATVVSDETQSSAPAFTLNEQSYVMGREGLSLRLSFTGQGTRSDATAPRATILYGGHAVTLSTAAGSATYPSSGSSTSAWTWAALAVAALALLVAAFGAFRG